MRYEILSTVKPAELKRLFCQDTLLVENAEVHALLSRFGFNRSKHCLGIWENVILTTRDASYRHLWMCDGRITNISRRN
ncbi:unnamed protein product [Lathyrus sativus]|nr:unnamed protein product [Lathyrus sativus]